MSFHTGQSFVFGEQPSATKWNYLWDNDYALADGSGIEDDAIIARHISAFDKSNLTSDINPYKFSVYRNAALNTGTGGAAIVFDTETYDSNNDYNTSNGRYTASVAGYYALSCGAIASHNNDLMLISFAVNGSEHKRLHEKPATGVGNNCSGGSALVYLGVGDYATVVYNTNNNRAFVPGPGYVWFTGFLVSRT